MADVILTDVTYEATFDPGVGQVRVRFAQINKASFGHVELRLTVSPDQYDRLIQALHDRELFEFTLRPKVEGAGLKELTS